MIMSVFVRRGDDDVGELECVKDGGELGAEGIDTVRLIMTVAGGVPTLTVFIHFHARISLHTPLNATELDSRDLRV